MSALTGPAAGESTHGGETRLYLLQGVPAVGKLTLARELERRTGAIVVDNHLVNNAVFVPMGMDRDVGVTLEQTDALRARVMDVVLEATLAAPAMLSHVFTIWVTDAPENAAHVERLRVLADRRGARFVPVWLSASPQALLARVDAPGRAERSKLVDPAVLRGLLERPELPAPPDALRLDLTETAPAQAVDRILDALG
ncbi:AAA family ATPase [Brachybacterium sp. AOP43-C2-M15]|uniref:AAA family ATPase n=1 Tax=Brachybacterium sp. AOP43-C2-M15 TaxID=3457661 RepID=UPI004033CE6E